MGDADWDQESDYARYVLRGPSAEDLRHKADLDRKRAKEEGMTHWSSRNEQTPREQEDEARRDEHEFGVTQRADEDTAGERHLEAEQGQPEGWVNE